MQPLSDTLGPLAPACLPLGAFLLALSMVGRRDPVLRAVSSAACVALGLRYVAWRLGETLPQDAWPAQTLWASLFVAFECANIAGSWINHLVLSRTLDRSPRVDAGQNSALLDAPVDVFIATYNESREILERTILGARAIEHRDKRVWVLDDGARDWVRDLADELGVLYVSRVKGRHAKAGNVNNGLRVAMATGRPPAFILLLDADFVAARRILRRTLPLFQDVDVAIVQTPQHFFNPDPIQLNLLSPSVWPDEQRFFFNVLMPSLDAWGGACCCGTSAVLRVTALRAVGGMATQTVTEDMLTSFQLAEHGWRTIYLDEPLSLGLAPEGIGEYATQRGRWCLGAIQQIHTRWSFCGFARIPLIHRLVHLSTVIYWSTSFVFRLLLLAAPAVWWWTGASVIDATPDPLLATMLPYAAMSTAFMIVYGHSRLIPVLSDVSQLVSSPAILAAVATGLVRPFGRPFRVTPKGVLSSGPVVHWSLVSPFLILAAATGAGLLLALPDTNPLRFSPGFGMNVVWSLLNIAVLVMACAACIDVPRRRRDERFASGERAVIRAPGRALVACTIVDLSVGGARLRLDGADQAPPRTGRLWLDQGAIDVPFDLVQAGADGFTVSFHPAPAQRHALILKLFDPKYRPEVEDISIWRALSVAVARAFG